MDHVAPKQPLTPRQKIAQLVRMLGSDQQGEQLNVVAMLKSTLKSLNANCNDLGDVIEREASKYSEAQLIEFAEAVRAETRAEAVEQGIKIGEARAKANGKSNGHGHGYTLPSAAIMAEHCHYWRGRLRSYREREFVDEMIVKTQQGRGLSLRTLGYLASLYIGLGGRTS